MLKKNNDTEKFYSKENIKYLEKIKDDIEKGQVNFQEHELIEE